MSVALASVLAFPGWVLAQEEEGPPATARLLDLAPPGTWAAVAVDMRQVLASMQESGADLPPRFTGMRAMAFFLLPTDLPIEEQSPPWCGVVLLDPETRGAWEEDLVAEGSPVTVDGLEAYATLEAVSGFAAPDTLLNGEDEDCLGAMLKAYRGEEAGLDERMAKMLDPRTGAMVLGAMAIPGRLADLMPVDIVEYMPDYMHGVTDAAFEARMDEQLKLSGFARMGSPEDAEAALVAAEQALAAAKEQLSRQVSEEPMMAMFAQSSFAIIGGIEMQVREAEVHASLELEPTQLGHVGLTAMMPVYMMHGVWGETSYSGGYVTEGERKGELNLHEIGLGIAMWRADHDGQYPPDLAVLVTEGYLEGPETLIDVADDQPQPIGDSGLVSSYRYAASLPVNPPPGAIVCYTRKGVHPDGRTVLRPDASVQHVSEEELHDPDGPPETSLQASYEAVIQAYGEDLTDQARAALQEFYEIEQ
ncbi:MAG: hypothetical protein R6V05_07500 [Candidatus Brocadiia bacterium]